MMPSINDFIELPGRRGIVVSPLDIQTCRVQIPRLRGRRREEAIGAELRKHYPGDPAEVEFDYLPGKVRGDTEETLVFAGNRQAIREYQSRGGPLIPGIALMAAAARRTAGAKLAILETPRWIEAARVSDTGPETGTKVWAKDSGPVPPSFLEGLYDESEAARIILIHAGKTEEDCSKDWLPAGSSIIPAGIDDCAPGTRRAAIFNPRRKRVPLIHGALILFLLFLNGGVTLRSLWRVWKNAETRRESSLRMEAEQRQAPLPGIQPPEEPDDCPAPYNPFTLIAELRVCLEDAWLRSLVFQEGAFSLEAEGGDAIETLRRLESSRYFRHIRLHQVSPSAIRGERFSLSGALNVRPASGGAAEGVSITGTSARLRALLDEAGIRPSRFRITGKEPDAGAEFTIRSEPLPFLTFLKRVPENAGITVSYLSMKSIAQERTEKRVIDITMRVKNEF